LEAVFLEVAEFATEITANRRCGGSMSKCGRCGVKMASLALTLLVLERRFELIDVQRVEEE